MKIPSIKINGIFYHGTVIERGDVPFTKFCTDYSDWNAIWFTEDEAVAREFSDNACRRDSDINIVYKVKIRAKKISHISYELYKELIEYYGEPDLREVIPELINKGFHGWVTIGSLGSIPYDDYAIFDLSTLDAIEILGVSLKDNDQYSDYTPICLD
jgi:hypothetical protein